MRFPQILVLMLLVVVVVVKLAVHAANLSNTLAKPGCPQSCGNLTIPYPFGTSTDCCRNESFLITCNDSKPYFATKNVVYNYFHSEYLYLDSNINSNLTVLGISLNGELRVSTWLGAYACYNKSGGLVDSDNSPFFTLFPISTTKNKLTVVGCDTYAYVQHYLGPWYASGYISGCMSICDDFYDVVAGSCSCIGCCQTLIREGVSAFQLTVSSYKNQTDVIVFNPCGVAYLAEEGSHTFFPDELSKNRTVSGFAPLPVVLDWAIGNETCEEARTNLSSYACGQNSICYNSTKVYGYLCNCSQGYQGNPYLSNGCQGTYVKYLFAYVN
ncbi:wall-associated receptor kinase 2-like [Cornus florida]|uniref:wall-associated receptor kinase 2-like n=1 Tax=Cornus florida TaxID=4283 RepID=UPI00289D3166|nr:wall-associated receptor kinase 2-like [Cornus florida]